MRLFPGDYIRPPQQEEPQLTEWEWDEQQRRHFRRLGPGTIEYAPMIQVGGALIENIGDNLEKANAAMKEAAKQAEEAERRRAQKLKTEALCPFLPGPTLYHDCKKDCALYRAAGCALKGNTAPQETEGKPCPFLHRCSPKCALYNQGCTL